MSLVASVLQPLAFDTRAVPTQAKDHQQTVNKANLKVPRPNVERRRLERHQQIRLRPRFYKLVPEEVARRRDFPLVEGHVRAGCRR